MRLRTISRFSVLGAVLLVGAIVTIHGFGFSPPALVGTDLASVPSPDFQLVDQSGASVALHSLKGRPVVLAFMYTHCPDVCPLTAEEMHAAATALGAKADDVAWVAVSVDPAGDTPASATQFAATHGLTGKLRFLLGSRAQLSPIWTAYHLQSEMSASATQTSAQPGPHTGGVFVLDKQGRQRVYLDSPFDPKSLATNLQSLLAT